MSKERDPSLEPIRAFVARVEDTYVVTYPLAECGDLQCDDSVTFSFAGWQGRRAPECDQVVELFETYLWRRGRRSMYARPVTPRGTQQKEGSV